MIRFQPWIRDGRGRRLSYAPGFVSAHPEIMRRVRILAEHFKCSVSFVIDCALAEYVHVDIVRYDDPKTAKRAKTAGRRSRRV